jgi:GNAT superfamily N-acetyltransferase
VNPDPTNELAAYLAAVLGVAPQTLAWPREFVAAGHPAVYDPHNSLLVLTGARAADFEQPELRPWRTADSCAQALCSRILVFAPLEQARRWSALGFLSEGSVAGYWANGRRAHLWAKSWGPRAAAASGGDAAPSADVPRVRRRVPVLADEWLCRPAEPRDAAAIGDLLRAVFPTYPIPEDPGTIRYALASGRVHGRLICQPQGRLVAYASAEFSAHEGAAEITDCATATDYRGRGLMSHLVARLRDDLADVFGCRRAHAFTREDQPAMQRVVARLGWRRTGRLVRHFRVHDQWVSAGVWTSPRR